jgi:hypothetical protein
MRRRFRLFLSALSFLSLITLSISTLTGCAKEQDYYSVPPDVWHELTPEQQQLIAEESNQYSGANAGTSSSNSTTEKPSPQARS